MLLGKKALLAVQKRHEFEITLSTPDENGKERKVRARKLNAREAFDLQATASLVTKDCPNENELYLRVAVVYAMFVLIDENGDRMFDVRKEDAFVEASDISTQDAVDIYEEYARAVNPKTLDQRIAEATEKAKNSEETEPEGLDQNSNGSVSAENSTALTPIS